MSSWTHLQFIAEVTTGRACRSRTELKEQIGAEPLLSASGTITGSEHDAETFINIPTSPTIQHLSEGGSVFMWDTAYITVVGHLRGRTKEDTEKEVQEYIAQLRPRGWTIRNITYRVYSDSEELQWSNGDSSGEEAQNG